MAFVLGPPQGIFEFIVKAVQDIASTVEMPEFAKRLFAHRGRAPQNRPPLARIKTQILLPVSGPTREQMERDAAHQRGQHLARQEMWGKFCKELRAADLGMEKTGAGKSVAELLALGARGDIVAMARHALLDGQQAPDADIEAGLAEMDEWLEDAGGDYPVVLICALTHMDIGDAWRGLSDEDDMPAANRAAFLRHYERAATLLKPFCAIELQSPMMQAASCRNLAAATDARIRISGEFSDLIELDAADPHHMRRFGLNMLPRHFGSYEQLQREALRVTEDTAYVWGLGGYAWMWFDAVLEDPGAMKKMDVAMFCDGLGDILARDPDQHSVNLVAAQIEAALSRLDEAEAAGVYRAPLETALRALFAEIIKTRLKELHPVTWAHAMIGFNPTVCGPSLERLGPAGRETALIAISQVFRDDLDAGHSVEFRSEGILITEQ